ncbi:MAG: TPM domain-containing protein [Leptospiraceae bacterium]|nr:TPM domain-containing protein [Leptospiraceae bacterium]
MKNQKLILLLCFIFITCASVQSQKIKYIEDQANLVSPTFIKKAEEKLKQIDNDTSVQIFAVTIQSLSGENIDNYSTKLANRLGVGQRYLNNGCLVLLAKDEGKLRIELGYGLEWIISNEDAGIIIQEMIPHFKNNDFESGFNVAFNSIEKETSKYSWKIESNSIRNAKASDLGKIYHFQASYESQEKLNYYANKNQSSLLLNLRSIDNIQIKAFTTITMSGFVDTIMKQRSALITGRLVNLNPLYIQLMGVD